MCSFFNSVLFWGRYDSILKRDPAVKYVIAAFKAQYKQYIKNKVEIDRISSIKSVMNKVSG